MMSLLLKIIDTLASSYWFIPALMAVLAFVSAIFTTQNAWMLDLNIVSNLSWISRMEAEGARTVMATIAGSMITVAGVTFSITISSIVHATTQFGPRLLTNFMHDRGNQITLGTFIATFLYCLLVLSSISGGMETEPVFVPQFAVLLGVVLALGSTMVLIYFVHHVPASIHASHVISSVGKLLLEKTEKLYPIDVTKSDVEFRPTAARRFPQESSNTHLFRAMFTGYIQFLDVEGLEALAEGEGVLLVINVKPGDFVSEGDYIAWTDETPVKPANFGEQLCAAFLYGDRRTPSQDILFLANELVEIASRALSPGINDPFTAMMCLDWLSSSYALIANRRSTENLKYNREGVLRVVLPVIQYQEFIQETIKKLMPYVSADRNATLHMQASLGRLMINVCNSELLALIYEQLSDLLKSARVHLGEQDIELLEQRHAVIASISSDTKKNAALYHDNRWLRGGV